MNWRRVYAISSIIRDAERFSTLLGLLIFGTASWAVRPWPHSCVCDPRILTTHIKNTNILKKAQKEDAALARPTASQKNLFIFLGILLIVRIEHSPFKALAALVWRSKLVSIHLSLLMENICWIRLDSNLFKPRLNRLKIHLMFWEVRDVDTHPTMKCGHNRKCLTQSRPGGKRYNNQESKDVLSDLPMLHWPFMDRISLLWGW